MPQHLTPQLPLGGPLGGTLPKPYLTADAYIAGQVFSRRVSSSSSIGEITAAMIETVGYWSPLTNGDPVSPELLFDSDGDVIMAWTPTP